MSRRMKWKKIADRNVRRLFARTCGDRFSRCTARADEVYARVYCPVNEEAGTPCCPECGKAYAYVRTEIRRMV